MNKSFSGFFGLNGGPFKLAPDADYFYQSEKHHNALNMLEEFVNSRDSFALLEGEPGTGKSTTLKRFIKGLSGNVLYAYIMFPSLSADDIYSVLAGALGIDISEDIELNLKACIFEEFINSAALDGKSVIIFVDEAHSLPINTLQEIIKFSNIQVNGVNAVKVILSGNKSLSDKLEFEPLLRLNGKINLKQCLEDLNALECTEYINYRLSKAAGNSVSINNRFGKAIWKYTGGKPRLINTIMERTIVAAHLEGANSIKHSHLASALKSLNIDAGIKSGGMKAAAAVICILLSATAIYKVYDSRQKTFVNFSAPVAVQSDNKAGNLQEIDLQSNKLIPSATADNIVAQTIEGIPAVDINILSQAQSISEDTVTITTESGNIAVEEPVLKPQGRVISNRLNVRSMPDIASPKIVMLIYGDIVHILDETEFWYEIELENGLTGWVFKEYMDKLPVQNGV